MFFFPTLVISFPSFGASSEPVCIAGSDLSERVSFVFVRNKGETRKEHRLLFLNLKTSSLPFFFLKLFALKDRFLTALPLYCLHFSHVTSGQTPRPSDWVRRALAFAPGTNGRRCALQIRPARTSKAGDTRARAAKLFPRGCEKDKAKIKKKTTKSHMAHICIIRSSQTSALT